MDTFKLTQATIKDLYKLASDLKVQNYKKLVKKDLIRTLHEKVESIQQQQEAGGVETKDMTTCRAWFEDSNDYLKKSYWASPNVVFNKEEIRFELVNGDARFPTRKTRKAAGFDLCSYENTVVRARDRALVGTGVKVSLPDGTYGRIAARSGLAVKNGIDVGAGVVDADYTGEIKVLLFNHSKDDYDVKKGDRIAQLVCEHCKIPDWNKQDDDDDDDDGDNISGRMTHERGDRGFGSSGTS